MLISNKPRKSAWKFGETFVSKWRKVVPTQSPINVTFDESNGSYSIYFLEVLVVNSNHREWLSLIYGFPSLGAAMSFCQPQMVKRSEFKLGDQIRGPGLTNLDSFWQADLKADNDFHPEACCVRIKQLVMVLS
jgi:hypothetical protein